MSKDNVELAYRSIDAINRRDLAVYLALSDDEIEGVSRLAPIEGGYHGHDGIRRWWETLFETWPDFTVQVVALPDALRLKAMASQSEVSFCCAQLPHRSCRADSRFRPLALTDRPVWI